MTMSTPEGRLIVSMRTETFKVIADSTVRLIDENGEAAPLARQALLGTVRTIETRWPALFKSCAFLDTEINRLRKRLAELEELKSRCPN